MPVLSEIKIAERFVNDSRDFIQTFILLIFVLAAKISPEVEDFYYASWPRDFTRVVKCKHEKSLSSFAFPSRTSTHRYSSRRVYHTNCVGVGSPFPHKRIAGCYLEGVESRFPLKGRQFKVSHLDLPNPGRQDEVGRKHISQVIDDVSQGCGDGFAILASQNAVHNVEVPSGIGRRFRRCDGLNLRRVVVLGFSSQLTGNEQQKDPERNSTAKSCVHDSAVVKVFKHSIYYTFLTRQNPRRADF
jgi:hypothetical protein